MRALPTLALLVMLLPAAAAYSETDVLDATASTHQWLMTRVPLILEADGHGGLADLLEGGYLTQMRLGSMRADETLWDSREHYMDPATHVGFLGFRSAGDLAAEQFSLAVSAWLAGDRKDAIYHLGWSTHLVQDLTVPHHARRTALDSHAEYESWVLTNQAAYGVDAGGLYALTGAPHGVLLNTSDPFDWVDANAHVSYDLFPYVDGPAGDPGSDYDFAASAMLPLAQRTSAGFVRMFFDTVDLSPPTADGGSDLLLEAGSPAYLDAQGSLDDLGIATYEWDLGDGTTVQGESVIHSYPVPGTYAVRLTATDLVGKSSEDQVVVTVVDRTPPRADAGPDRTVTTGEPVTLDGTGSWDKVGVVNYTWIVGGEEHYGPAVTLSWETPGTVLIGLRVADAAGNEGYDAAGLIVTPTPLTVQVASEADNLRPKETTRFWAETGPTGPVAVEWWFGDGETAAGTEVHKGFDAPGTYRVLAVATDSLGRISTDTLVITVSSPESAPSSPLPVLSWALLVAILGTGSVAAVLWRRRRG